MENKIIEVNGAQVIDLTPNHDRPLALVDFAIVKKLSHFLPQADFQDIKRDTIFMIEHSETLEDYIKVLEEEVAFHKTVNLLQTFYLQDIEMQHISGE
jgi:hypothetical protein